MIDLDDAPVDARPSRLVVLRRALSAPAPTALVVLAIVLLAMYLRATIPVTTQRVAAVPVEHDIFTGLSAYPATATAQWVDTAGVAHDLDPDLERSVRLPARAVVIAVSAGDQPVQCTLRVDGRTVDFKNIRNGIAVCAWAAAG
jgi:hypothetical protein